MKKLLYAYSDYKGACLFEASQVNEAIECINDSIVIGGGKELCSITIFEVKEDITIEYLETLASEEDIDIETYLCELNGVEVPNEQNIYGVDNFKKLKLALGVK